MNQEYLEFMAGYLDKIEEALEFDSTKMKYTKYVDNIFDIIIEIGNVFEKELPEIKTSVFLNEDSLNRDADTTIGIIKKFLIKNGYKKITKIENKISKFWISFKAYFEKELPTKGYLKDQFLRYDNWNGEGYYLDLDYNYQYNLQYGVDYIEPTTISDIKLFIELAFNQWIENRYEFTKDVNAIFQNFKMPYKLQKGKVIKVGYKTTITNEKIINFTMLERKIQYAEEMIMSQEVLDKKCALDYIIDSLQYIISIQKGNTINEKYATVAKKISSNVNGKVYSVVKNEISELMKISNEYFDIRHNEYLNKAKEKREAITDPIFIEYLYNRVYSLLYILKLKQ